MNRTSPRVVVFAALLLMLALTGGRILADSSEHLTSPLAALRQDHLSKPTRSSRSIPTIINAGVSLAKTSALDSATSDHAGYVLTMDAYFLWVDVGEDPPLTAEMSAVAAVALPLTGAASASDNAFAGQDVITLTQFSLANGGIACSKAGPLGTISASGEVHGDVVSDIRLLILADTYVSCPIIGDTYNLWFSALYGMHEDEIQGQDWDSGVLVEGWTSDPDTGAILKKVYDRTETVATDLQITELTTFRLWEMPPLPEVGEIYARGLHTPNGKPETGREVEVWADVAASADYELRHCIWNGDLVPGQGDPGDDCSHIYTPVPDHGPAQDTYGDKDVTLTLIFRHTASDAWVWTQIEGTYQVYFAKYGFDQGADADPNWFVYWADDGAVPGLDAADVFYEPSLDGYGRHANGDILIGPRASQVHYNPPYVIPASATCPGGTFGGAEGIDAVAEVLAHERRHEAIDEQWRHIGTNTCGDAQGAWGDCTDGDGDQLPNDYEATFGTASAQADSCGLAGIKHNGFYAFYGDQEMDAMVAGNGLLGSSTDDWANRGKQSDPGVLGLAMAGDLETRTWPPSSQDLAPASLPAMASLAGTYTDQLIDPDSDGLYEALELSVGVNVVVSSTYNLVAVLEDAAANEITWAAKAGILPTGTQTVTVTFPGPAIWRSGRDGPYRIAAVELQTGDHVRIVDDAHDVTTTTVMLHTDFEPPKAALNGHTNDVTQPLPGDPRRFGDLRFDIGLEVYQPGRFTLGGILAAGQDRIGTDVRSFLVPTGTHTVTLVFSREQVFGRRSDGPYTLRNLRLTDGNGNPLSFSSEATTTTAGYAHTQFRYGDAYVDVNRIHDQAVDADGDGLFDRLDVTVPVTVTAIDAYRVAAYLEDGEGGGIDGDWQALGGAPEVVSTTKTTVPTTVSVTLSFDGQAIAAHGVDGPYQVAALSVLGHDGALVDALPLAYTTQAYDYTDFAVALEPRAYLPLVLR